MVHRDCRTTHVTPHPLATPLLLLLLGLCATAAQAAVGPSQATVASPGGFATACASEISAGATYTPGRELQSTFDFWAGRGTCGSQVFTGLGSAAASSSWDSGPVHNASAVKAQLGAIHLSASNLAPKRLQFPIAVAGGGWTDTMTIDTGVPGQAGIWTFSVAVDGLFILDGGSATLQLAAYRNSQLLGKTVAGFSKGVSDPITTDAQLVAWGLNTARPGAMHDVVSFAVPFVSGQAFSWGVYATGWASIGNWTPSDPRTVSGALDFANTLRYAGSLGVRVDGVPDPDATLTAASGLDWRVSSVPEPATWCAWLVGLAGLGGHGWLRRRAAARTA